MFIIKEDEIIQAAVSVMGERGHQVTRNGTSIEHRDGGFSFRPRIIELEPISNGRVRTVTTMTTTHPEFAPGGIFEYQHATGNDVIESVRRGFDDWAQIDLTVFLDARRDSAKDCATFEFTYPPSEGATPLSRRALLGPIMSFAQYPRQNEASKEASEDEHCSDCPCCLLMHTFEAFRQFVERSGFFGIRLVAIRNEHASSQADCRINGEDYEPGARALREYVDRWPQSGFEIRKQYVVLQDRPRS